MGLLSEVNLICRSNRWASSTAPMWTINMFQTFSSVALKSRPTSSHTANPSGAHVSVITSKRKQTLRHNAPVFFFLSSFAYWSQLILNSLNRAPLSDIDFAMFSNKAAVTLMNGRSAFWVGLIFAQTRTGIIRLLHIILSVQSQPPYFIDCWLS